MKICFLTRLNPFDQRSWSGICYQMFTCLAATHDVTWIGNKNLNLWLRIFIKLQVVFEYLVNKKRGYSHFNKLHCVLKAKNIERELRRSKFDLIIAPNAPDYIAYLQTDIPILYLRDTTFQLFIDYYPTFFGLSEKAKNQGNEIEKHAIDKSWKIVYSSTWAAASAINYYGASEDKLSVVDFGANLRFVPSGKLISDETRQNEVCNILFIGLDWERKGGDVVYKTFLKLRKEGFKCKLTIVGCKPRLTDGYADIDIIPFLNKENDRQLQKLISIYQQAHFLFLPSKADCTPVVFSEAAAFGIPVITTNTGGTAYTIHDGVNGYLFPVDSNETVFSEKIRSVFEDVAFYKTLRLTSRKEYEIRLSWNVWLDKINQLIATIPCKDQGPLFQNPISLHKQPIAHF